MANSRTSRVEGIDIMTYVVYILCTYMFNYLSSLDIHYIKLRGYSDFILKKLHI